MKFVELAPHYHSASIFAFPSVCEEACPLPPIEAMAPLLGQGARLLAFRRVP